MINNKFKAFLAFYMVTLSFIFLFIITLIPAAQNVKTNDTIIGFLLGTGLTTVINYSFRTSGKPEDKDLDK